MVSTTNQYRVPTAAYYAVQYAVMRDDKAPLPGFSREIINNTIDKKYWENLDYPLREDIAKCSTFLEFFERNCEKNPDHDFLGTREKLKTIEKDGKPFVEYGEYKWRSRGDVRKDAKLIAQGVEAMGLAKETEGDGRKWRFIGIWSKNREEWLVTHISNMYFNNTTIGFFDSMG